MEKTIPLGNCQCGCGQKTLVPKRTSREKNWVKGVPMKYCRGHYWKVHKMPEEMRRRNSEAKKGSNNPMYKGGIYFDKTQGRWMINCRGKSNDMFAVAVARNKFGRFPSSDELVHHKDEDKLNDSLDNLEIMTRSEHGKHHISKRPIPNTPESQSKAGKLGGESTKQKHGIEYYQRISRIAVQKRNKEH